ncbi:PHD finger protein ING2 [Hibiscus syriacus]|uniref:PHD finger protein ING2 n=1 Tax=Hibiscus syriacus TaxID=106335 RepID=A0A6A2Z5A5_HIBSY|nr:PHD finger protein ING2 [Hibiscus syriacus]
MAIARTGFYVDDYLEYASTLPAELQRLQNTIRELDERSQSMINQARQQTKYCLALVAKRGNGNSYMNNSHEDEDTIEKMKKDIEAIILLFLRIEVSCGVIVWNAMILLSCAHPQVDNHVKCLDEDLTYFAEDLKHEGKIPPDEPAILPPLPIVPKLEKLKPIYFTPQSKRLDYRDRDWD